MNADDLLRRALESLNDREAQLKELGWGCLAARALEEDIRTYLDAPKDECQHRITDARNKHVQSGYVCIDCKALFSAADHGTTKTAPKKPMTEEEIDEEIATNEHYCERSFAEGVRFAERHHGIGGGE